MKNLTLIFLTFLCIATPITSFAQEKEQKAIDSLQKVLKTLPNDSNRVKTLNQIAVQYINLRDAQTKGYAKKAIKLAQEIGFSKGEADAYVFLGVHHHNANELKEAIFYYKKASIVAEKVGYQSCIERSYQYSGYYYYTEGNYTKALDCYLKALAVSEKQKNLTAVEEYRYAYSIMRTCNSIGLIYHIQKDFDKAMLFLEKALSIAQKYKESLTIVEVLGNISGVQSEQKKYASALKYAQKAFNEAKAIPDTSLMYDTQNEVAKAYAGLGQIQKGIDLLNESLAYFQKSNDIFNEIYCQIELCRLYIKNNQFDKAQNALDNALKATQKDKPQDQIRAIYEEYTELYKAQGDYKRAFEYMEKHNVLKDTIFGIQKIREMTEMEHFYENEQKEKALALEKQQNSTLKAENRAKNLWIAVLGLCLFVIVLVALLVIRNSQHRLHIAKQALKNTQENITTIQQELHKAEQDKAGNQAEINQLQKMLDNKRTEVLKHIKEEKHLDKYEGVLEEYINLLMPDFTQTQKERYHNISKDDLYLLFFREINMSNRDIATKFGVSEVAIRTKWSRFNKKYKVE